MKVEAHTIRYGNPDYMSVCAPTLDRWVAQHGYPLRIWTEHDNRPEYPCLKFCVVEMLRGVLAGDSDWLVYIDADIYVRPDAPRMEFLEERVGMLTVKSSRRRIGTLDWWCRKYGEPSRVERMKKWWPRNCGWFAIDRDSAERLLQAVCLPYFEGTMEECQMNYWMALAVDRHGLKVHYAPKEWHRFFWQHGPGWMWHLARQHNKMLHLERIRCEGKVA